MLYIFKNKENLIYFKKNYSDKRYVCAEDCILISIEKEVWHDALLSDSVLRKGRKDTGVEDRPLCSHSIGRCACGSLQGADQSCGTNSSDI